MEYGRMDKYFLAVGDFWFQTEKHNGIFCLAHQSRSLIDEAAKLDLLGRPVTVCDSQRCAGSMLDQNRTQTQWWAPETLKLARLRWVRRQLRDFNNSQGSIGASLFFRLQPSFFQAASFIRPIPNTARATVGITRSNRSLFPKQNSLSQGDSPVFLPLYLVLLRLLLPTAFLSR